MKPDIKKWVTAKPKEEWQADISYNEEKRVQEIVAGLHNILFNYKHVNDGTTRFDQQLKEISACSGKELTEALKLYHEQAIYSINYYRKYAGLSK